MSNAELTILTRPCGHPLPSDGRGSRFKAPRCVRHWLGALLVAWSGLVSGPVAALAAPAAEPLNVAPVPRRPTSDAEWKYWLQNMVWYHHFTPAEIQAACGLSPAELPAALSKYGI